MINREKSKKSSLWKTALYLPATAILIIAAATINSKAQAKEPVSIAKNAEWKLPEGWGRAGSDPGAYRMGIDPGVSYEGNRVASIKSIKKPKGFGTLMQTSGVGQYAGKRVRMSGYMKSEGLKYWAGFWLRADKGNESVAFDNMHERAVKGTTAWTKYDIVLDIPADAQQLAFGVLISGEGQVWFSGIKFEVVGKDVAVTNAKKERRAMPEAPINLDFNK